MEKMTKTTKWNPTKRVLFESSIKSMDFMRTEGR